MRKVSTRGLKCHYCHKRRATTKDHIVPKARGGQNTLWNYVPACFECNQKKKDDWPNEAHCIDCAISVALHAIAGITEESGYVRNGTERSPHWENDTSALSPQFVGEI